MNDYSCYSYGYGVWLVVKDNMFADLEHIPHVTIMCCMEKEEAKNLYNNINESVGKVFEIRLHNTCKLLPNSYKSEEQFYSSGFDCSIIDWPLIQTISEKYSGSFSYNPHLSYHYSLNIEDLKYKNFDEDYLLRSELHLVDITDQNFVNWNILT